ncbi:helix-turn-helix domain-containing protein [Streptomyces chilikensis]|uniref:helix-turn-helix domain-containing protein n=1 Tax=Streptomyces chilikensis TaxID=1194079 RepID=UPI000B129BFF|nr:helix-turn-helix domain-containing protein [Streptomyces chilikensis]
MRDDELLTVPEAMARLKIGRSALYDLLRTHRLTSLTIGRARRIPAHALDDYVQRHLEEASR